MKANLPRETRYDDLSIWLHWATALLVVEQWIGGKTIDMWSQALQADARSLHLTLGLSLGLLLSFRIAWRATRGRQLPNADSGWIGIMAKAVHWGLYAILIAVVALGVTLLAMRGDAFFGAFHLGVLVPASKQLRHTVQSLHELLATTVLVVAGLHAAAALFHHYVLRDGVLARMGRGRTSRP